MHTDDSARLETRATTDCIEADRTRVPVSGGVLVYEQQDIGRELIGFEDVDDWNDLRTALATRGHDVGAVHHKPVIDGGDR